MFAYLDQVNMGRRLYRQGEFRRAEKALKQTLNMAKLPDRERSAALLLLGHCRLNRNDFRLARAEFQKVLDLEALVANRWHQSEAVAGIARSFEREGKKEQARAPRLRLWNMDGAQPCHLPGTAVGHRRDSQQLVQGLHDRG